VVGRIFTAAVLYLVISQPLRAVRVFTASFLPPILCHLSFKRVAKGVEERKMPERQDKMSFGAGAPPADLSSLGYLL